MLISGFEKLTLLDYPGKLSAIVFTYGCNMLCPYCHNPELVIAKLDSKRLIKEEDVISYLLRRKGKIDALTITGGEPTLHKDLPSFVKRVKELGYLVKLDTNGSNPSFIRSMIDSKLVDYWALDIKYAEELYEQGYNGGQIIRGISESIELIKNYGADYEFRTTFVKGMHNADVVDEIGKMIKGAKIYYLQNFRPGKTIDPNMDSSFSFASNELQQFADQMKKYVEKVVIR